MKSQKDRMVTGESYDPLNDELVRARIRARELCRLLNTSSPTAAAERAQILASLLGSGTDPWIEPPFFCDYGWNLRLGRKVYFNFNCVVLDVLPVTIGDHTLIGPAVQIYTALHPLDAVERRAGLEYGRPIRIGADVWIGGAAIICPGVTVGDRTVIGAGSVVTRDIPSGVVAAGNPCRVLRPVA